MVGEDLVYSLFATPLIVFGALSGLRKWCQRRLTARSCWEILNYIFIKKTVWWWGRIWFILWFWLLLSTLSAVCSASLHSGAVRADQNWCHKRQRPGLARTIGAGASSWQREHCALQTAVLTRSDEIHWWLISTPAQSVFLGNSWNLKRTSVNPPSTTSMAPPSPCHPSIEIMKKLFNTFQVFLCNIILFKGTGKCTCNSIL